MVQLRSKERDVDGFPVAANGGDKDRGWWKKVKELFKRKDCETKKPMRMSRICNKSEQKIKSNQQHEKLGVSAVKIEKEKMIKERTSLEAQIDSLRNKEKDRRKAYKKSIKDMKVRAKDIKKKIGSEKERLRAELQMDKDRLKIMAEDEKKKSKEEMKELQERLNKIEKDRKALKKATRR